MSIVNRGVTDPAARLPGPLEEIQFPDGEPNFPPRRPAPPRLGFPPTTERSAGRVALLQRPRCPMRSRLLAACAALALAASAAAQPPSYLLFESGPVRPIALTPSGHLLLVANAPDNRLELFRVEPDGSLVPSGSVPVGLEPVAVAARTDTEVWVVNHLSDSVSIVDLAATPPRVRRTLLVGDEPRDI